MSQDKFRQLSQGEKEKLIKEIEQESRWKRNAVNYKIRRLKGKAGLIERIREIHKKMKNEGISRS